MKINTSYIKNPDKGIVYILYIDLEYEDCIYKLTKIGVTTREVEKRVVEILTSIFKKTRVFPRCYVKRFRTVSDPYGVETELLKGTPNKSEIDLIFSGSTECYCLDEQQRETLLEFYESTVDAYNKKAQCNNGI